MGYRHLLTLFFILLFKLKFKSYFELSIFKYLHDNDEKQGRVLAMDAIRERRGLSFLLVPSVPIKLHQENLVPLEVPFSIEILAC